MISIHTPAKGVTNTPTLGSSWITISIHTPAKGVTQTWETYQYTSRFQSTLPRREWHFIIRIVFLFCYFNPHSREGSDTVPQLFGNFYFISIHTPAKGVTQHMTQTMRQKEISIHTPAKGVTTIVGRLETVLRYFNPHSREGSDFFGIGYKSRWHNFNPHSREGSDFFPFF